jgi:TatD DNase family protein
MNSAPKIQTQPKPETSLVYTYQNGLYVNLTYRCPTACTFCIKYSWDYLYRGYNLKLKEEPKTADILAQAGDVSQFDEVIFCGYGESTYRVAEMKELAQEFRRRGAKKIRLNTIGLGNLVNGRDIAPELGTFLDVVSVSLNTVDPQQYVDFHRPLPQFKDKALASVKEFIASCVKNVPQTFVTAVDRPDVDVAAVEKTALELGAQFRKRPYLDDYQEQ